VARREANIDDEKRSYSALFLVCVGLLLLGAVWAVWDDNISRRPWKRHQAEFSRLEVAKVRGDIDAENKKLEASPEYQQAVKDLEAAETRVKSGETAERLAKIDTQILAATVRFNDADLAFRIIKSRLEEAWYEYEAAELEHRPTEKYHKHIEELDHEKAAIEKAFNDTRGELARINNEKDEILGEVKTLEAKIKKLADQRDFLTDRLSGITLATFAGIELPIIPKINQVVLPEFERNNFDQPVARVERCVSCHVGIDKAGFEDAPQPYRTHSDREKILAKHPVERFGCTPCHQGQGAAVNSPEQAHGEVHHWDKPLLRGEKVEASCIKCHATLGGLAHGETIARGEKLFEELGCHGCHLVDGYESLAKVGPYLRLAAAKLEPSWLVRWVTNPHEFRPSTRMPNFLFKQDEAEAIAGYLLSVSKEGSQEWLAARPLPSGIDPTNTTLTTKGKELVDSIGCRGCHGFAEGEAPAYLGENKDVAPNLSKVAEKTDARWMYHWIKGPRDYSPVARMPNLRLSDDEAKAVVSYLLTLGNRQVEAGIEERLTRADNVDRGKALVRKYGCFACHDIPGMEKESRIGAELASFGSKTLEELFFGNRTDIPQTWDDWTYHKIKEPRTYATERIEQLMPQFDLADADIRALRIFLKSRTAWKYPQKYWALSDARGKRIVEGRRLVARYNCVGCHVIENEGGAIRARYTESPSLAPPILNGQGSKVQPDWFFSFIKQPVPIRPWLKVRMPTFGLSDDEASALVQYFGAVDDIKVPFVYVDENKIPADHILAAQTLVTADYFNCFSCHQQGDRRPEGPPEGWAPDLGMARKRLNPEWIIRWLHNPQKVTPGTKMPSFYEEGEDGKAAGGPDDVLDGDNERQIVALRDYLMVLNHANEVLAKNQKSEMVAAQAAGNGEPVN